MNPSSPDNHDGRGPKQNNISGATNMQMTLTIFQGLKNEFSRYEECFELWREHRKRTIDAILKLKTKMDDTHFGSNIVQCISSVAGIAGGIIGIASAGVSCGQEVNQAVTSSLDISSTVLGIAGSVGSMSAIAIEKVISKEILDEIQSIMKKDMELTIPIVKWLKLSRQLNSLLNQLFNCSVWSKEFQGIMALCGAVMSMIGAGETSANCIRKIIESRNDVKLQNLEGAATYAIENGAAVLETICANPQLMESMKIIYKTYQESPFLFEFSKLGMKVYLETKQRQNVDLLCSVKAFLGLKCESSPQGQLVTRILFETIKISTDAISLITASTKIHEKARSEYSDMLEKLLYLLSNELKQVSAVHQSIVNIYYKNGM